MTEEEHEEDLFEASEEEEKFEKRIRPQWFREFIGQKRIVQVMTDYKKTYEKDYKPMHFLLTGPPGLGKTTIAHCLSNELDTTIHEITGVSLKTVADLATTLKVIEQGDVLFVDEIHRLGGKVQTALNTVAEDFWIGTRPTTNNKTGRWEINPFILIGATTEEDLLRGPLLDRFHWVLEFDLYPMEDLIQIINRTLDMLKITVGIDGKDGKDGEDAITEMAARGRGTPRVVNKFCRWLDVYIKARNINPVYWHDVNEALWLNGAIDRLGCGPVDRKIMRFIAEQHGGGPVGLGAISSALGKTEKSIKTYESYLFLTGLMTRKGKTGGREITKKSIDFYGWNIAGTPRTGGKAIKDKGSGKRITYESFGTQDRDVAWDRHMENVIRQNEKKKECEKEGKEL